MKTTHWCKQKSLSQHGSANEPFARYCTFCVKIRHWLVCLYACSCHLFLLSQWSETEWQARLLSEDSLNSTVVKMERRYGNEDYADMHFMYVEANGNALEAARLYQETFPHRRQPDSRTFTRVHQRLREYGSFAHGGRADRPKSVTPDVEERVLKRVAQSPGTSTRWIAAQERVLSRSNVCGEFYIVSPCTLTTSNAYRVSVVPTSLPELTSASGCNNRVPWTLLL
jgi:hypothetical protein